VDERERRLIELLTTLNAMFEQAGGGGHPWIDQLLDPAGRRDVRTSNYLTATASGTLRDRIFCAENHDSEPAVGFEAFNQRYCELLGEATKLAKELDLPAASDG
jgi:hypothetical protein